MRSSVLLRPQPVVSGAWFSDARGRAWGGFLQVFLSHLLAVRPSRIPANGRPWRRQDRFQDLPAYSNKVNITQVLRDYRQLWSFKKKLLTRRAGRRIRSKTARMMLLLRHYEFRQHLKWKAWQRGALVGDVTSEIDTTPARRAVETAASSLTWAALLSSGTKAGSEWIGT